MSQSMESDMMHGMPDARCVMRSLPGCGAVLPDINPHSIASPEPSTEPPHFGPSLFALFAPSDAVFVITFLIPTQPRLPPLIVHHDRFRSDLERIQQRPHFLLGCFLGFHSL